MLTGTIADSLIAARRQVREAAEAAGRDPAGVRLVAVSKTVATDHVLSAYAAGQRDFAENLVPELVRKAQELPAECVWHLIGHLQRNKVRPAVQVAAWVHSVDSVALLERLERIAEEEQRTPAVLLQVNLSGESTKSGVSAAEVAGLLRCALGCRHLSCRGLMTMAPFAAAATEIRAVFGGLRCLRDRLEQEHGVALPELSMGMSSDFRLAIAEGATLVRLGTAIFGARA